jgi:hypothetical protein
MINLLDKNRVGYWMGIPRKSYRGDFMVVDEPELPRVQDFIDPSWDKDERRKVVAYLKNGTERYAWRGPSMCRICGCMNGSTCLTDGEWVWPEGFDHYLQCHNVKPVAEFLAYLKERRVI